MQENLIHQYKRISKHAPTLTGKSVFILLYHGFSVFKFGKLFGLLLTKGYIFPFFFRGDIGKFTVYSVKISYTSESAFHSNIAKFFIGIDNKIFCIFKSVLVQKFLEIHMKHFLEKVRYIVIFVFEFLRNAFKRNIFLKMLFNVFYNNMCGVHVF